MGKRKKVHIGLFDGLFMLLAVGGFVCAIVGLFVPWMGGSALDGKVDGGSSALFSDELKTTVDAANIFESTIPLGLVQAFAIIAAVLAGLCAVGVVLKAFEVVRIKGLLPFLFAVATIVIGALVAVFSFTLGGNLSTELTSIFPVVGMYLCAVGTIVSGAAMFLKRG